MSIQDLKSASRKRRTSGGNGSKPAPTDALSVEYGAALIGEDGQFAINQQHFAARYVQESGIVHDPSVRRFYQYDPATGLWLHQSPEITAKEIGEIFHRIVNEHSAPFLLAKRTANMLQGLVNLSRGIGERRDVFNQRHNAIHVGNGMLVLDDAGNVELRPFAPEYFSRNRSEIAWNPEADCPRFKSELLLSAMSEEDANLIQRYIGQCLLGVNLSQTILLLRGMAGGGKSTLANVVEGMIGRHNVTELRIAQLCERFEIQRLVGRTVLSGKDVPGDFLNLRPAHVLKALVGGDTLEGETKHGNESFSVEGRFNVLISTNTRLRVRLDSDTGAWRRRLLIVDYLRPKPAKPIPGLDSILLRDEGEGILRYAVEGAIQLRRELAATGTIQLTDEQRRRVDDLLSESDSVRSFVRDCVESAHGAEVFVDQLTTAYRDYCERRDWEPLRDQPFQQQLPDAMLEYHRAPRRNDLRRNGKSARGFRGVQLKQQAAKPSNQPLSDDSDDLPGLMQVKQKTETGCLVITPGASSESSEPTESTNDTFRV